MCISHSNGIDVFQSGGGATCTAKVAEEEKTMLACGMQVHRLGEVALVRKTHTFSLNLLPLTGVMWLCGDNHSFCSLPCSNYDKEYYTWRFYILIDSSPNPEDHPYGAKDLHTLQS